MKLAKTQIIGQPALDTLQTLTHVPLSSAIPNRRDYSLRIPASTSSTTLNGRGGCDIVAVIFPPYRCDPTPCPDKAASSAC